jgi:predicted RNA-binding protein with PUA-like domain
VIHYWFFASNPTDYHWDTLFVKGKDLWNGLRGTAARRYLRQVRKGDRVVCYHGPPERVVYALALAASDPYPVPAEPGQPPSYIIDLKALERLPRSLSHKELKANRALRRMKFLSQPRLSVTPLSEAEYKEILRMAGMKLEPAR